jgi:hypothetical protein
MKRLVTIFFLMACAGDVFAQPAEPPPPQPPPPQPPPPQPPPEPEPVLPVETAPEPLVTTDPLPPPPPAVPVSPTVHPEMFRAPTGRLLPAGHLHARGGLDTGGGGSAGLRVGLGDVAEFGLDLTDLVRARSAAAGADVGRIFPYGTASFKMGVGEHLLFRHQPAVALGFRKSFEHEEDGHSTRFAELYLVGSKQVGQRSHLHLGASLWDAAIETGGDKVQLNDGKVGAQLKAFGGVEVEPLPDSAILLEVSWTPEFRYGSPDQIKLIPMFTWGVRYTVASWMVIESGVRIPDIRDVDLLGAQIFGQVKLISRGLERMMKRGK